MIKALQFYLLMKNLINFLKLLKCLKFHGSIPEHPCSLIIFIICPILWRKIIFQTWIFLMNFHNFQWFYNIFLKSTLIFWACNNVEFCPFIQKVSKSIPRVVQGVALSHRSEGLANFLNKTAELCPFRASNTWSQNYLELLNRKFVKNYSENYFRNPYIEIYWQNIIEISWKFCWYCLLIIAHKFSPW